MDTYQKVLGGRPLVFILGKDSGTRVQQGLAALASAATARGLPAPYVAYMGGDVPSAMADAKSIGAQAISNYNLVEVIQPAKPKSAPAGGETGKRLTRVWAFR